MFKSNDVVDNRVVKDMHLIGLIRKPIQLKWET